MLSFPVLVRRLLPLSCFTLLAASFASAQDPPPDFEVGLKPYGSFHGGEIDSVSMSQGGLSVHIPLLSYPQRGGKLKLDLGIYFNSYDFGYRRECSNKGSICDDVLYVNNGRNVCVTEAQTVTSVGPHCKVPQQPGGYLIVSNPTLVTSDGAHHPVGNTGLGWSATVDGTGFRTNASSGNWVDQAGITYGNGFREDSNGNKITLGSTSWTDSLNRTIPYPPASSNSTDTSGCVGPLAVTGTYLWNVPGPSGGTVPYKFCFANVTVSWSVYAPDNGTTLQYNQTSTFIQSILLPNGQSWEFEYNDTYGNLTKITFPTGGSISYTWTTVTTGQTTQARAVYSRTVNANDGTGPQVWSYTYRGTPYTALGNGYTFTNTVMDPLGNYTDHIFTNLNNSFAAYETQTNFYDKSTGTAVLVKSIKTDYEWTVPTSGTNGCDGFGLWGTVQDVVPIRVTTVWPNGQTSKVENDYDSAFTYKDINPQVTTMNQGTFGKVVAHREYEYGPSAPGPLLRQTKTAYLSLSGPNASSYLANNLLSLPYTVQALNGSGTQVALTTYGYDQTSLTSSGITTQHDSAPPTGTYRGNQTSVSRWLNTTGSNLTSNATFYDTGTVPNATDPLTHATARAYSTSFAGAYATTVTNALSQSANHNYDFNTGLLTSTTDPNNLTTSFSYDNMWRVSQVTHPDGGTEIISHQETTFPFSATLTKQINSAQSKITTNVFDGLGRVTQSQLTSDPQGTVYADTTYDALGRVHSVSNPYRTGTDITTTTGTTIYAYDALGRKTSETYPDNSVLTTAYCGPSTLVTDPTGKWRRSRVDGLGRLVEVDEPNAPGASVNPNGCPGTGEPIWVTTYGYDTLGNLTSVLQNGSHQRSFTYDSLSRLMTATNPETGTITYAYNNDGALISKTDARNITTNYSPSDSPIDVLHRVTKITYSNGDPSITYAYDQAACLGLSTCQNIGHRTGMTDAGGSESWSYHVDATNSDTTRRTIHVDQRTTNSSPGNITKTATYYLDLVGNLNHAGYPTGRVVDYTFDSADRPSTATDGSNGITYAAGPDTSPGGTCLADVTCYTPQGTFYALSIGETASFTGLSLTHIYNSRLQPSEFKASSTGGNAIDISYNFVDVVSGKNAGYVYGITNNLDTSRSQTFTYDQLNRITSALTTSTHATSPTHCWGETYTADAWGNLQSIAATTNSNYTGCTQESGFSSSADGNNHLAAFSYDLSGNTQNDGTFAYNWNAESQLKSAGGVTYAYNGDGRRVAKVGSKLYWYGSGGEILGETDASGNTTAEYIFFAGQRIAQVPATGSPIYYVEDLLGTSRVITTNIGVVCYDADFYPYGGERTVTNTCPQNYKFEGKERDSETSIGPGNTNGNDDFGARYYSNRFGRWLSADWSAVPVAVPYANLNNPQTLNLYTMIADDPESFADLDGHDIKYDTNLKNAQLVKDTVQVILADPNTSANLAGYVGPNNPDLTIQSGDLSAGDTRTVNPDGSVTTTTVQGNTAPDIQSGSPEIKNGVEVDSTKLTGATITIDNRTSKGDVPGVMVHETVHAGEAKADPAKFSKDAAAEKSLPHDQRPQEQRANAAQKAYTNEIKKAVKQIEKDRKKENQ